jgi:hypothetical protein
MGKRPIKHGSLTRFCSNIELTAEQVFKTGTTEQKIQMAKMLLPYCYREQPKELTTPKDEPLLIRFT